LIAQECLSAAEGALPRRGELERVPAAIVCDHATPDEPGAIETCEQLRDGRAGDAGSSG
jgi:hypothetical protein